MLYTGFSTYGSGVARATRVNPYVGWKITPRWRVHSSREQERMKKRRGEKRGEQSHPRKKDRGREARVDYVREKRVDALKVLLTLLAQDKTLTFYLYGHSRGAW